MHKQLSSGLKLFTQSVSIWIMCVGLQFKLSCLRPRQLLLVRTFHTFPGFNDSGYVADQTASLDSDCLPLRLPELYVAGISREDRGVNKSYYAEMQHKFKVSVNC